MISRNLWLAGWITLVTGLFVALVGIFSQSWWAFGLGVAGSVQMAVGVQLMRGRLS